MTENNWSKWGEDIKKTVQDSIDSRDFSNLNKSIGNIVDSAIKNIDESLKSSQTRKQYGKNTMYSSDWQKDGAGQSRKSSDKYNYDYEQTETTSSKTGRSSKVEGAFAGGYGRSSGPAGTFAGRYGSTSWDYSKSSGYSGNTSYDYGKTVKQQVQLPKVYGRTGGTMALGIVSLVFGILGIVGFSIAGLVTLIFAIIGESFWQIGGIISTAIMALFLGGSIFLTVKGNGWVQLVNRFNKYKTIIGTKMYAAVQELADKTGNKLTFVRKDLRKMIKKGFFLQGRMDANASCLMVSDEAYKLYLQAQQQYQLREQEKKRKEAEGEAIPENVRQIIAEGERFIQKIKASNDAIPGVEISRKISYMENIVQKIFQRVQQKPQLAGDVKKLMSYYLPTTIKLLEAYEELDAQPIQGPNIQNSKKEIEDTMDTLNTAFEKILDDFYQDTAWDISSDISVLETMLAQEGLMKSDFE